MTINKNYLQQNVPSINLPTKTNFKASQNPLPQDKPDTVEIQSKISTNNKNGLSANAKLGIGLGVIATIVGGILLHKNFAKKVTPEGQQAIRELPQTVKNLISEGRLTTKEAEMFEELKDLEGEEFVTKAYELIAKDMNMEKIPKLNISHEINGNIDGHAGKEITIYLDNAIRLYGNDNVKSNIIDILRHELEHYKQDIVIFLQKGDKTYETAFTKQKHNYLVDKALFKGVPIVEVLNEEATKYGYNPKNRLRDIDELYKIMFEHDTPIQTIRIMTPCDFEKLHLTQEELAKADEYLEGIRNYMTEDRFPENFFLQNGHCNIDQIMASGYSKRFAELQELYLGPGYVNNPLEVEARQAGESLRDKFKLFLDAIRS